MPQRELCTVANRTSTLKLTSRPLEKWGAEVDGTHLCTHSPLLKYKWKWKGRSPDLASMCFLKDSKSQEADRPGKFQSRATWDAETSALPRSSHPEFPSVLSSWLHLLQTLRNLLGSYLQQRCAGILTWYPGTMARNYQDSCQPKEPRRPSHRVPVAQANWPLKKGLCLHNLGKF
jgi:hypothetical protein